jgi:putative phage-type endonuclease
MEGRAAMVKMITYESREAWLEGRKSRIGGSEASAVVGLNPYMSNVELWEIKTGRRQAEDISEKNYVKYGTEAEKHLRALFALDYPQFAVDYVENNMFINDRFPWLHASLDGFLTEKETGRKGILEIKTTNILQSMQREKWDHKIPDNYYIQILHYLAVTEFDFAKLRALIRYDYGGDIFANIKDYTIERAEVEDDIKFLIDKELDFVEYFARGVRPPLVLNQI